MLQAWAINYFCRTNKVALAWPSKGNGLIIRQKSKKNSKPLSKGLLFGPSVEVCSLSKTELFSFGFSHCRQFGDRDFQIRNLSLT